MSPVVTIANAIKAFLVVALVVVAGWWLWSARGDTFRYRLTVAVESGGNVYTGSGVIQVQMRFQEYWAQQVVPKVTGDSVIVDVPGHSPVFVLLTAKNNVDWDASIAFKMFQNRFPTPRTPRGDTGALAELREKAEIPATWYPMMVAFEDVRDSKTVYEVNPNDTSRALGPDSRVISMIIEMTDDRVTTGTVDLRLPWLAEVHGNLLGKIIVTTRELADNLGAAAFRKRGI